MEKKNESKEQQWKDSISQSSSSRSSSITSVSSDGHFDIAHLPIPKPSLSVSEAEKQKDSHQAYSSFHTGSSCSSVQHNQPSELSGYDQNRIPISVFSNKPVNSTEWSIASNESLFSLHDGNFSIPTKVDHGLAPAMRFEEIPKYEEEPVHENPVLIPPVKELTEPEKETIIEKKLDQMEKSNSEIDVEDEIKEEEMTELESNDEHKEEEEENMIKTEILTETETEKAEDREVENVKDDNKPEDSISTVSHSPSISCRSDNSNNSVCSFAFPVLHKEDGLYTTPTMEIKENVSGKRRAEYMLPPSPMQPSQPQPQSQSYTESGTPTQFQPKPQTQRKFSKQFESQTQSQKPPKKGWFSCFHCPSKCGFFK